MRCEQTSTVRRRIAPHAWCSVVHTGGNKVAYNNERLSKRWSSKLESGIPDTIVFPGGRSQRLGPAAFNFDFLFFPSEYVYISESCGVHFEIELLSLD